MFDALTPQRTFRRAGLGAGIVLALSISIGTLFACMAPLGGGASARDVISWISIGPNGALRYGSDRDGNQIPDFSAAGYEAGGAIPNVETVERIAAPSGGDDTAAIQSAIDAASGRPVKETGFRGAVELGPGKYRVSDTLKIRASGVVLRGAGMDRTQLNATASLDILILVEGSGAPRRTGNSRRIVANYTPVGGKTILLDSAADLSVGNRVFVQRPMTKAWIAAIGMDRIPVRSNGKTLQWAPGASILSDRTIVAVHGNAIELDTGLTDAISLQDDGQVWRYRFEGRIERVGVESLSARLDDNMPREHARGGESEARGVNFLTFGAAENGWVRNVSVTRFGSAIIFLSTASNITATDFTVVDAAPLKSHGALPAVVSIDGQKILVSNCRLEGGSYIAWATQSRAPGPNVVRECEAHGNRTLGQGHQRWATGLLFDNVKVTGSLHLGNRGNAGSGQGWSAANSVLWNSSANTWLVENPPTARNWAFGMRGRQSSSSEPPGEIVSPGRPVEPQSLYRAQLQDRLRR